MPKALPYSAIHTDRYESWVIRKMRAALNEAGARNALSIIASMLQSGEDRALYLTDSSQKRCSGKVS